MPDEPETIQASDLAGTDPPADPPTPQEPPVTDDGAGGEPPAEPPVPETPPAEPPKHLTAEERIARIEAAQRAADELARRLAGALEKSNEVIAGLAKQPEPPKPSEPPPPPAPEPQPVRESFDDPAGYDAALVEWASRKTLREATAAFDAKLAERDQRTLAERQQAEEREQVQTLARDWSEKRTAAIAKYPDFAEVAERDDLPINRPMAEALVHSGNGPEIAYWLGQNPEEAKRIAAIPHPVRVVVEIAKIAAKLEAPAAPQVSRLPTPVTPLRGTGAAATARRSPEEEPDEEYATRRLQEIRARGRSPAA